jgi:hypothetical protein
VTSTVVLAHHLAAAPTVACITDCNVGTKPSKVTITVQEHNPDTGANDYTYTLTGAERLQTSAASGTTTGYPPFLLLDNGSLSVSGKGTLVVNGRLVANSGSTHSVQGNGGFSAGSVQAVGSCTG